ncbi:C45 family autoproteolytic acyltransferase/hydolase [Albibacillus kandeliae]|uniref:C45 family autoproteolytic acyltransferase/hydolase n=1 Tax=Albibacillus kandeliae TaxID=2174228 RepID=UPI000D69DAC6|nr:C45 family peptidase [Albibacillus kandeliae]
MTYVYRSQESDPFARGRAFGAAHPRQIATTVANYRAMCDDLSATAYDLESDGAEALVAIEGFAPHLAEEVRGMAEGAGLDPRLVAAINARTEILARIGTRTRGECSAVIALPAGGGAPVAVQTWDWYHRFSGGWLVWEIPHADGSMTKTMTEYGIVGKAGLNTRGIGLLFTILHHTGDGAGIGVPVHVAARAALDLGADINRAAQILAAARVSASSSINLAAYEDGTAAALTVELHPGGPSFVLPDNDGLLIHTNHFLAPAPAQCDTEPAAFPDTLVRHNLLHRRIAGQRITSPMQVVEAMTSHLGSIAAVCCHHDPRRNAADQYETLATLSLDLAAGVLNVHAGGPCTAPSLEATL